MFRMHSEYDSELYQEIQNVYDKHYVVEILYTRQFNYENGAQYGFVPLDKNLFFGERIFTADAYVEFIKTNADLITIRKENEEPFFGGIREAILRHGNRIALKDTFVLDLYRKP